MSGVKTRHIAPHPDEPPLVTLRPPPDLKLVVQPRLFVHAVFRPETSGSGTGPDVKCSRDPRMEERHGTHQARFVRDEQSQTGQEVWGFPIGWFFSTVEARFRFR